MSRNLFWLSDAQWQRIEPYLPTDVRGVERQDDRRIISGIIHVLKSGCRWSDCPEAYGPATTIYNRFARWARRGIWENLFRELAGSGRSTDTQMINSTHVKAHRSAAGGKGPSARGERNTKIHGLADAKGRLIAILLTGGEAHDCPVAERLIRRAKPPKRCELSLKVGDGGNREGGISWGCLTPPLLHRRSDMPCPKITSSS